MTSDMWTLHPPMASLQPSLLILQGRDQRTQGQRNEGRLLCFPSPVAQMPSAQPPRPTAREHESCAHPQITQRAHTRAHPQTLLGSPPCPAPATHTGPSSLSLPTPHASNLSCSWHWSMELILVTVILQLHLHPSLIPCHPPCLMQQGAHWKLPHTAPRIPNPFPSRAGPQQHLPDGQGKERARLSRE